ncbi:MAG: flagellar basal body P-ring protein FlgI [Planctomycetes bacterium]|nr:flagellar basal body P-ring protein FlgI [Planctomycetota bacterium]
MSAASFDAFATSISDVSHLKGRRSNTLMGYGLVVGLSGTGDGGKYAASIRQLQAMLNRFEIPVTQAELTDTKNVAIVWVEVKLPENGVREGDSVDVQVSAVGAAKSLQNGRLIPTPLQGPGLDRIFAFAQGAVRVLDPKLKSTGVITNGAVLEEDVIHSYINDSWEFTLVLEDVHASHALAAAIAQAINEDQSEVGQLRQFARAIGPKNVVIDIPIEYRPNPAEFIGRVEGLELLMPTSEGRIVINRRTDTIIVGEGVEMGPAAIVHGGMTIRMTMPEPKPTEQNPKITDNYAAPLDTTNQGGPKLQDLVNKLNQLNVPAKDIIEIVENLYKTGKIRGKLVYQE